MDKAFDETGGSERYEEDSANASMAADDVRERGMMRGFADNKRARAKATKNLYARNGPIRQGWERKRLCLVVCVSRGTRNRT